MVFLYKKNVYEFKREMVCDWRNWCHAKYENEETTSTEKITFKGPGRPSMVSQELTAEIKMILHNLRISGCAISRKTAIVVGTGVFQSKSHEVSLKNGDSIKLTTKWIRGILKFMEWSKCRGTTAKREMNPALCEELTFSWKKDIEIWCCSITYGRKWNLWH